MKTHVVCIDGTGNSPHHLDRASGSREPATSNVFRVFRLLTGGGLQHVDRVQSGFARDILDHHQAMDLGQVFYRWGVGTGTDPVSAAVQQATGRGTTNRIISAYRFLAAHHEDGDKIFAFGFSRGAFAVRSLAGLVQHAGLPASPHILDDATLKAATDAYFYGPPSSLAPLPGFRPARIDFLGLWDTVRYLKGPPERHEISPSSVRHVAHALALDELRPQFAPELWNAPPHHDQHVDEAWFTGAHSNIGGGYAQDELSNVALAWVVSKAVSAHLPVPGTYAEWWLREHTLGHLRDSHKEFLPWLKSFTQRLKGRATPRSVPDRHLIHRSVLDRIAGNVNSEYNKIKSMDFAGWRGYIPSAQMADGSLFRTQWPEGQVAETPDYLSPT